MLSSTSGHANDTSNRNLKMTVIGSLALLALALLTVNGVNPIRGRSSSGTTMLIAQKGKQETTVNYATMSKLLVAPDNTLQQLRDELQLHFTVIAVEQQQALGQRGITAAVVGGVAMSFYYLNGGNTVDDIILKTTVGHVRKGKYFGYIYPELELGETEVSALALSNRDTAVALRDLETDYLPGNFLQDSYEFFQTTAASEDYILRLFTSRQPSVWPARYLHTFDDMTSDAAMDAFGFFSLASHLMKKIQSHGSRSSDVRADHSSSAGGSNERICDLYTFDGCNRVVYYLDLTAGSSFDVRAPYVRYGAVGFYSGMKKILGIYVSHLDSVVLPGDDGWDHAKYAFKTSAMVLMTTDDHLVQLHLIYGNEVVTASREVFPLDHPVGRLLAPHMFNVATPNFKSPALLGYGQFIHRGFAFTFDAVYEQHNVFGSQFQFETFPETLKRTGMDREDPKEFGPADGVKLFDVIRRYVGDYLRIYYPNNGDLTKDVSVVEFFQRVSVGMALTHDLDFDFFADLIAQFMFSVSGMHENVGGVLQLSRKDDQLGARMRAGQTRQDVQAFVEIGALAVLTTGNEPKLKDDYSKVFLDDAHKSEVLGVYGKYRQALLKLEADIDALNPQRPVVHEYLNFSPKYAAVTVSI